MSTARFGMTSREQIAHALRNPGPYHLNSPHTLPTGRRQPVHGGAPTALRFEVLGIPEPQGSKDAHHHDGKTWVTESNKKVRPWRVSVIDAASRALDDDGVPMMTGAVSLAVRFRFLRPKSHFGTGRNAGRLKTSAPDYVTSRRHGDSDKLLRAVCDALTQAGVWRDDSQVVSGFYIKVYDDRPGASIEVVEL